jgi:plasmid stabilization system protein ParE
MSYRIRFTERARRDLVRVIQSRFDRSPGAAEQLNDAFEQALHRLGGFPPSCGLAHESRFFGEELRHLLFWVHPKRKHRALFVVRGDEVVILAIRAPGEKPVSPDEIGE